MLRYYDSNQVGQARLEDDDENKGKYGSSVNERLFMVENKGDINSHTLRCKPIDNLVSVS